MSAAPRIPLAGALAAAALIATALAASCYQVPALDGLYKCSEGKTCPDPYVCDDGVCCTPGPGGVPECPSYVGPDGRCSDGGTPRDYYQDQDGDGFGADGTQRQACRDPASYQFALDGGDCNDNPTAGGAAVYPGAVDQCDGVDNNCNGERDESSPRQTYWRDQDLDGFGDPGQATQACAKPAGYTDNSLDCQPLDLLAFPGAAERCNGADDNCNGSADEGTDPGDACSVPGTFGPCVPGTRRCVGGAITCVSNVQPSAEVCDGADNNCNGSIDDATVGSGQACTDATRVGACRTGVTTCSSATMICQQTVFPSADICDGVDNDCDGTTDTRPSCGGPTVLGGTGEAVTFGAKRLNTYYNGAATGCLKDAAGETPNDTVDPTTLAWRGSDGRSHVFWAESTANTWDLTQAGATLRLPFTYSISSGNSCGTNVWANHHQPVIHICSPNGFLRLVYTPGYLITLTNCGPTLVDNRMPLRAGSGWVIGANSSPNVDAVLRSVRRIEVLIQPELAVGGSNFLVDWDKTILGFQ